MSVTFNIHSNLCSAEETLSDAQVESMLESNDTHIFAKDVCTCFIISTPLPKGSTRSVNLKKFLAIL